MINSLKTFLINNMTTINLEAGKNIFFETLPRGTNGIMLSLSRGYALGKMKQKTERFYIYVSMKTTSEGVEVTDELLSLFCGEHELKQSIEVDGEQLLVREIQAPTLFLKEKDGRVTYLMKLQLTKVI